MNREYTQGMHQIGQDCWAWIQPDGGWGWSNAGLVTDGECSLLVDTLYDLDMTANMLSVMRDTTPAANDINVLVNSHADGDHTYGNQIVGTSRIIASKATAAEFFSLPPAKIETIVQQADVLGEGAQYIAGWARDHGFTFAGNQLVGPTETYERELDLKVGDKEVRLINVGPAHTAGDTLVHSIQDKVVYTGDILFMGVHPAIWAGSLDGWLAACDRMLTMDVDVVVPGHGPITDKQGVRLFHTYLASLRREARIRFEAGLSVEQAADDIRLEPPFDEWLLPERIAGSVNSLFLQWGSPTAEKEFMKVFDLIARYAKRKALRECAHGRHVAGCGHQH
ncbi:MBL fold metallo-hydrolase [Novosphingobium sp. PP1Y]|uniref:MBL fold metallo-hydrolase n=1 Tax=Novosphingobium sp. PP1Y TaxID=702113 RepID=UPI00020EEACE|nr:MBL fold metallo-hydrolase [Novosphingobium sp. PP1Y]CCA92162.1 metallo-beta-lactamase family protein [Novosphingobium sp. PP1Y]